MTASSEVNTSSELSSTFSDIIKVDLNLAGATDHHESASSAFDEIADAALFANQAMGSLASEGAVAAPPSPATDAPLLSDADTLKIRDENIRMMAKRLKSQRERGRDELQKTYAGALVIVKQLKVYDVNIASSAERFLGVIDRALYTINRSGPAAMGSEKTQLLYDQLVELIEAYCSESVEAAKGANILLVKEKEAVFEGWVTPEYSGATIDINVRIKHRMSSRMVDSIVKWDTAIHDLCVLDWNGKVDSSQTAQLRAEERRHIQKIAMFALRAINGMNRAVQDSREKRAERAKAA